VQSINEHSRRASDCPTIRQSSVEQTVVARETVTGQHVPASVAAAVSSSEQDQKVYRLQQQYMQLARHQIDVDLHNRQQRQVI
jgi:hypothetical protein